jgi:serine/threonine protein kinase
VESLLAQPVSAGFLGQRVPDVAAPLVGNVSASLWTGRRLGIYQLQTLVGKGGMGEVYRARDTRLGRDVAIKILSHAFTADPDRLARFEREARLLASLNHPNVATIHGVEESDGVRALVMEFVEGETLSDRLARGASPSVRSPRYRSPDCRRARYRAWERNHPSRSQAGERDALSGGFGQSA